MQKTRKVFLRQEIYTFLSRKKMAEPKNAMVLAQHIVSLLENLEYAGFIKIKRMRKKIGMHLDLLAVYKPAWKQWEEEIYKEVANGEKEERSKAKAKEPQTAKDGRARSIRNQAHSVRGEASVASKPRTGISR